MYYNEQEKAIYVKEEKEMPISEKIALSVPEAAALIGVSKTKMYELLKRSDCDFSVVLGGRRLISRAKLEAWIDRQTETQP